MDHANQPQIRENTNQVHFKDNANQSQMKGQTEIETIHGGIPNRDVNPRDVTNINLSFARARVWTRRARAKGARATGATTRARAKIAPIIQSIYCQSQSQCQRNHEQRIELKQRRGGSGNRVNWYYLK